MIRKPAIFCALAALLAWPLAAPAGPVFTNAVSHGTASISGLIEASGLVASRNNPDVLWTHNDSGDTGRLFAMDTQGRRLGIYTLPGISPTDCEDISIGPGPVTNVHYLFVGDIGDNFENRSNIRVYQIPEPAVYLPQYLQPATRPLKGVRTITLTYPDGKHNAEALFVDPWTGDLFIATKEPNLTRIYTARKSQLDTNNSFTLSFVRSNVFDIVSAADVSPSGTEILLRQEQFIHIWTRTNGQSISNAMAASPHLAPTVGTNNGELNGEAVAYDSIASGYYTVSEDANPQPLNFFRRISSDAPIAPRPLVAPGSSWSYLDNGSDQGTDWQQPGFDDSSWSNGLAQFGYGDGDEKTVISFGGNASNKRVTTYFRKSFAVENASCITNLVMKMVVDDGAAVYLNGTPAARERLAAGAAYNTVATNMPTALQSTWQQYQIDPGLLLNGTNLLAVEIHQSSVTSSNISFDLQLVAYDTPCINGLEWVDEKPHILIYGPTNLTTTLEASQTLTNWVTLETVVLTNGYRRFEDEESTNYSSRFYRLQP